MVREILRFICNPGPLPDGYEGIKIRWKNQSGDFGAGSLGFTVKAAWIHSGISGSLVIPGSLVELGRLDRFQREKNRLEAALLWPTI